MIQSLYNNCEAPSSIPSSGKKKRKKEKHLFSETSPDPEMQEEEKGRTPQPEAICYPS
jgi:hypothetical protein